MRWFIGMVWPVFLVVGACSGVGYLVNLYIDNPSQREYYKPVREGIESQKDWYENWVETHGQFLEQKE